MTDWQVLACGEGQLGIARCAEGHIHVELEGGKVTLRFDDAEFLAFARTVAVAAAAISHDNLKVRSGVDGPQWRN